MSKFAKRLKKLGKKHLDCAIHVGSDFSNLENLIETFNTVFVVSIIPPPIKDRKIIHIQDLDYAASLFGIDMIFVNQGFDHDRLRFFPALLRKTHAVVLLNENYDISVDFREFLFKERYEMIEILMGYQIWKEIRR